MSYHSIVDIIGDTIYCDTYDIGIGNCKHIFPTIFKRYTRTQNFQSSVCFRKNELSLSVWRNKHSFVVSFAVKYYHTGKMYYFLDTFKCLKH